MPIDTTVPAGSTGNLLMNMLFGQQNDPAQQMSDYSIEQNRRNRAALGLDYQGNLLPTPAPGSQPGVGSGQLTDPAIEAQKQGMLPPNQVPNAYKTEPTMGSMMLQMQRRQEAAAGLNTALGAAGAAISRPENRERSFHTFTGAPMADPLKTGEMLMRMNSDQQGQDRLNALGQAINDPRRGPAIAASLNNMSWEALKSAFQANPAGIAQMVANYNLPSEKIRDLDAIQKMGGGAQGGGGAGQGNPLSDARTEIINSVGGQPAMASAQDAWRKAHPNEPDTNMHWKPNDLASFTQHVADQATLSTKVQDAADRHAGYIKQALAFNDLVDGIQSNKNLDTLLSTIQKRTAVNYVVNHTDITDPISMALNALPQNIGGIDLSGVAFSEGEKALIADIRQAKGQQYASALHSIGLSRPTGAEVTAIDNGLSQAQNVNMGADDYRKQALYPLGDLIKNQIATSFGAAHDLVNMPNKFRTYVPPQFLENGAQHLDNAPPDGSAKWGPSMSMDEADQAAANKALSEGAINPETKKPFTSRHELDQYLRKKGKRPNY